MPLLNGYYSIKELVKAYPQAHYYLVIGERSNGKTYSSLDYAIERHEKNGEQFAYIRRMSEDIRRKYMNELFSALEDNSRISELTKGKWDRIIFMNGAFYLAKQDEKGEIQKEQTPVGYTFALNAMEHHKSISYPKITTCIFDEFISRIGYLPNEFLLFSNTLSTIIRLRDNVRIFMLANTVNKFCPYFSEMGLSHIQEQKQGTVDEYVYGQSDLRVVVEYCSVSRKKGKPSDVYFAFDNPELQMITSGAWEIGVYPHLSEGYKNKDVAFRFFIEFNDKTLNCAIVVDEKRGMFLHIFPKSNAIKIPDSDLVYTATPKERWNYKMALTKQTDEISRKIMLFFRENRVYYADNETGEIVRNYLMWSDSYSIKN